MATARSRKPTTPRPKAATRAAPAAAAPSASDGTQRQLMLLMLERKFRTLMHSAQELTKRLSDPNESRVEIEASLAENGIERQAVLAEHDAIEAGEPFGFPSEEELAKLRDAMARLETGIAQTQATEDLISATNDVINAVHQGKS